MSTSSQPPELAARITAASAALSAFEADQRQNVTPVDWLAWARRFAVELSGLLDLLDDRDEDTGTVTP